MGAMTVQTDTNTFRFGTQSLKVTTGDSGSNAIYPADPVAVIPGEDRTFSAYIKCNAAITGGSIYLRVAQSGLLTPVLAESIAITDPTTHAEVDPDGWLRVIVTLTIPDGMFEVRPFIQYTGSTAGQVFWLDAAKFEKGAVASAWQEPIVSKRAALDQAGFQVDAFEGGIVRFRAASGGTRDTVSVGDHGVMLGGDTEAHSPAAKTFAVTDDAGGVALFRFGGTSFPASPTTGDLAYRTDLGMWFQYTELGATDRWLCTCPHDAPLPPALDDVLPLTATATAAARAQAPEAAIHGCSDIWLEKISLSFFVSGGTALSGSHKWVGAVTSTTTGGGSTARGTLNIDSGSSSVWRRLTSVAVNALLGTDVEFEIDWTKTGTPGNLYHFAAIGFRYVAT